MKKIWLYIVPLFFLFGCEDFLDVENLTKKDTSSVPSTEEDIAMLMTAAYQNIVQIAPLNNPFLMSEWFQTIVLERQDEVIETTEQSGV